MIYKECVVCKLNLPISIMQPIEVNYRGRLVVVAICENCKTKKEAEAKLKKG
jgi:hypothetical protein